MKNFLLLKRIFLVIIGIPLVSFLLFWGYIYAFTAFYTFLGYHVGNGARFADGIAAIAAEKHDINECMKITYAFEIMGPTVRELQGNCISETARLSKDPRACLPLMPSPYGILCIGQVWGEVESHSRCSDKSSIAELQDGELQCGWYDEKTTESFNFRTKECSTLPRPILRDKCNVLLGGHYADTAYCDKIENPVLKSVCEVRIELQKKYPGIPELR